MKDLKLREFIATTIREFLNEQEDQTQSNINDNFWKWFGNSEVTDEDGNPLIVYHFTNREFDNFDLNKARTSGFSNLGFWFGSDADKSKEYGRIKKSCYLKIENGYYVNDWEDFLRHIGTYSKTFGNEANEFREYLQSKGYDGVIIDSADPDDFGEQTIYVVFSNNQIKCIYN